VQRTSAQHALAADQTQAATFILTSKDRVMGVQGYAGTGKTHMLRAVREVAERAGWNRALRRARPRQRGPAARRRNLLGYLGYAISSQSRRKASPGNRPMSCLVVDESSMISAGQARALVGAADRQKARLVLIGDRPAIAGHRGGRPFAMLMDRGMAFAEMRDVKRQTNPILREAVMESIARREAASARKTSRPQHTSSGIAKHGSAALVQTILRGRSSNVIRP